MEYLILVVGAPPTLMKTTWLRNRGYSIVSSVYQLHILQGPELSDYTKSWLKHNRLEVIHIIAIEKTEVLPPIATDVIPFMVGGKTGGLQLRDQITRHPDVPVYIQAVTDGRELVIRRVGDKVHIVFGDKEEFRYACITFHDFADAMKRGYGGSAFSKCNNLMRDIQNGYHQAVEYIHTEDGYDFEYMVQRLNWNWRE